ncbi:MAG TPA: hypothetical protein VF316_00815 [Polyangiaceae bacterium]
MKQSSRPARLRRRGIPAVLLVGLCFQAGCVHDWVPSTPGQIEQATSPQTVRVWLRPSPAPQPDQTSLRNELGPNSNGDILVVEAASVRGGTLFGAGGYTVDVRSIARLEARTLDGGATAGVIVASILGGIATPIVLFILIAKPGIR